MSADLIEILLPVVNRTMNEDFSESVTPHAPDGGVEELAWLTALTNADMGLNVKLYTDGSLYFFKTRTATASRFTYTQARIFLRGVGFTFEHEWPTVEQLKKRTWQTMASEDRLVSARVVLPETVPPTKRGWLSAVRRLVGVRA